MAQQHHQDFYRSGAASDRHNLPSPSPSPFSAQQQQQQQRGSPSPYYADDYVSEIAPSTYAPSSRTPDPSLAGTSSRRHHQQQQQHTAESPFDTPFDDHVYPASDPRLAPTAPPPGYHHRPSLSSSGGLYGPDTGYYGGGAAAAGAGAGAGAGVGVGARSSSPDDRRIADDIPLQDRMKDPETNDHIYDAPAAGSRQSMHGRQGKKSRGGLRFGELGMLTGGKKRIPFVVYTLTVVQIAVFIAEIVKYAQATGIPIQTQPYFNFMIGPSIWLVISMGARYEPCMHNLDQVQGSTQEILWPCPNSTTLEGLCTLSEHCGMGGVPNPLYDGNADQSPEPNQWWRFITPIFLHAGLVHIGFNLFLQLTIGKEMEQTIGSLRFFLVYFSAGIFGFVFGGKYAGAGIASTGASGALFGVIALVLLDLLYSWRERRRPFRDLMFVVLEIVISFVIGVLVPFLDNFAHIGGFLVGLTMGICVLHSPNALRRRIHHSPSYAAVEADADAAQSAPFLKSPVGFFKGRKPLWWAWWLLRAGSLVLIVVVFIVLLNDFYTSKARCDWCKYLSCVNINNWCDQTTLNIQDRPASETTPRQLLF